MRTLGKSVEARYLELLEKSFEFPEDGYQGDYIIEIAKEIINNNGKDLKENDAQFLSNAEKIIFGQIKNCLLYTSPSPRDRTRSRMPSSA